MAADMRGVMVHPEWTGKFTAAFETGNVVWEIRSYHVRCVKRGEELWLVETKQGRYGILIVGIPG